jgi:hypothetical protein
MCSAAQDAYIAWRVKLSSATDIAALAGLYDSALTSYIALSVDTAASSNFRFVANSGGSTTFVDTSIALDTNWHRAVMVVSTGAVSLFFDGVKQTAITTNITANQLAPGIGIKTITNRRYIYADWCECYCRRVAS